MSGATEIDVLLARAADGSITPGEIEALIVACGRDPGVLTELREHLAMERMLLFDGGSRGVPEGFTREILAKIAGSEIADEAFTPRVLGRIDVRVISFPRRIAAIAAVLVLSVGAWMFWKTEREVPIVASVTGSEAAVDFEGKTDYLAGQVLVLDSGFVRLRFKRGAEMILEGPARLEFSGDNGAVLKSGSASVHVPESATGFTLVGPDAKVIDVGTEFAMKVSPDRPTEVHVIDGLILTSTSEGVGEREMRKDQAIKVVDGKAREIDAKPGHFVNALPVRKKDPIGFLHWSFDEREGSEAAGAGPGISGIKSPAFLRSPDGGGRGPIHADGVFGAGIFLNGEGAFVETDFPGIGGSGARSVAMWVRVPGDWQPENGYAMASWGSFEKLGAAWQISVNPGDFGGEIGHLRVGTNQDYVVGNTDLRDGRWHHIAAVMYAGRNATAATHVLLYVDGKLETAEVKSTRSIDTDIKSESAVKLQLGKNLGTALGLIQEKNFFRGWIDEVLVADEALSQEQVRRLMKKNRLD